LTNYSGKQSLDGLNYPSVKLFPVDGRSSGRPRDVTIEMEEHQRVREAKPCCKIFSKCHNRSLIAWRAGIVDFRWHDLRHTFASRLTMAGGDLRTVQELMGHQTITMTMRYAHLAPSHLREAVQRISRVRGDTLSDTRPESGEAPAANLA